MNDEAKTPLEQFTTSERGTLRRGLEVLREQVLELHEKAFDTTDRKFWADYLAEIDGIGPKLDALFYPSLTAEEREAIK